MARTQWWWIAAAAAVVAVAVGVTVWVTAGQGSSSACGPVGDLMSFNTAQTDAMRAKIHLPEKGSTETATGPDDADYWAWSDGIDQRAAKVTDPVLAPTAQRVADLAAQIAAKRKEAAAQMQSMPPTDPGPPPAMID